MRTRIADCFVEEPGRRNLALVAGIALIAVDFSLVLAYWSRGYSMESARVCLALIGLACFAWLSDGDLASLGLRFTPRQGWKYWFHVAIRILTAIGFVCIIGFGLLSMLGYEIAVPTIAISHADIMLIHMCFTAPVFEETLYRLVLCVSLINIIGRWPTIIASGVLFGTLHVAYGNPSPENLVAGFFLAWAFFKSESIAVPICLHAAGNFIAFSAQLVAWQLIHGN